MPYTEKPNDAALTYKFKLNSAGDSIKIRFIFDSTLTVSKGGHQVTAVFDNEAEITFNINEDLIWENNYSKMYPAAAARIIEHELTFPVKPIEGGLHTLKLKPENPGVVFQKIIIDNGGYEKTFLNGTESPYAKDIK